MNAPITIDLVAPSTGHFIALGPMPKTCPDVLMSTNGIRAYRVEDLGDHNSIFALESFGHLVPPSGRVTLVPLADGQPVIDYSAHPAVLDDLAEILGELHKGFEVANTWLGATRLQVAATSLSTWVDKSTARSLASPRISSRTSLT